MVLKINKMPERKFLTTYKPLMGWLIPLENIDCRLVFDNTNREATKRKN